MFLVRYLCQPHISICEAFSSLIAPEFKRARLAQSRLLNSPERRKRRKRNFPQNYRRNTISRNLVLYNNFLPTTTFNVRVREINPMTNRVIARNTRFLQTLSIKDLQLAVVNRVISQRSFRRKFANRWV